MPGRAEWYAADPVYRVYGDFTLGAGNSTWVIHDAYFDTPDDSRGGPLLELRSSPTAAAD